MIKKWKIDKNAKANEMRHVIRIQNKRLREDLSKKTNFRIRHKPVDENKIERFKREHAVLASPKSGRIYLPKYLMLSKRYKKRHPFGYIVEF